MEKIVTLLLFLFIFTINHAQISEDPCCEKCIDTASLAEAEQSSTSGSHSSANAIGNLESYSLTQEEENPYWQIDIQEWVSIREFKVTTAVEADLTDYYIFTSYLPFEAPDIESLLNDVKVESYRVIGEASNYSAPNFAPLHPVRYVRIQKNGTGVLQLYQVVIPGTDLEDCNNGIDDDCDDLIDCQDLDCAPIIYHVNTTSPTCEVCQNGSISFQYWAKDFEEVEISIDGGMNWEPATNYHPTFPNLNPGEYNIMAKNTISGCTTTWKENPVVLEAPREIESGDCENGGFGNGNFDNWEAKWGTLGDLNNSGFNPARYEIVDENFNDPVGAPINLPFEGLFSLRLGNTEVERESEQIKYCLVVDDDNKDFSFNYAIVLEDPAHDPISANPFFEYVVFESQNPIPPIDELFVFADADDPFFTSFGPEEEEFAIKGWTCQDIDLSAYIGKEVCVTFTTGDCDGAAHFAYAYIDGLCIGAEGNEPSPIIEAAPAYCIDQDVIIDATQSQSYNEYTWDVCITHDTNPEECFSLSGINAIQNELSLLDIIAPTDPNYVLTCPSVIQITLTLFNGCGLSAKEEIVVEYICEEYEVNYQDILLCSETLPNIDAPFEGINNCVGCEYNWDPDYTLSNSESAFPTIMGTVNEDAFDTNYNHLTTTTEGCEYTDLIEIFRYTKLEPFIVEPSEFCGKRKLRAKVFFTGGLDFAEIFTLRYDNVNSFPGVLIEGESTNEFLVYEFLEFSKAANIGGIITAVIDAGDLFSVPTEQCALIANVEFASDPTYFGDIRLRDPLPNAFTPDGDGLNDTFGPVLPVWYDEENVFYGRMVIRQQWNNNIVFDSGDVFATNPNPLSFDNLHWDGTFQGGPPAVSGVFRFKIWLKNCTEGNTHDEGDFIAHGNVTLIR